MATDIHVNGAPRSLEQRIAAAQSEGLEANVRRVLRFAGVDGPIEFQSLGVRRNAGDAFERARAAHARTPAEAIALCAEADKWIAQGVYILPATLKPGVETRHSAPGSWYDLPKRGSTTDSDIAARRVLAIDFDVVRPSNTSATDEEMALSAQVAQRCWRYLTLSIVAGSGGRIPADAMAYVHSGNGRQIWIALGEIPANESVKSLFASILAGLDDKFSEVLCGEDEKISTPIGEVKVDVKLFDAKRILPACGTIKKKGAAGIVDRPHRRTAIVMSERTSRVELAALIEFQDWLRNQCAYPGQVAMDAALGIKPKPGPAKAKTSSSYSSTDSPFDKANALDPTTVAEWLDLYESGDLRCPGCGESEGVDIIDHGLKCLHNRCDGKGKHGFRTIVDVTMEVRGVDAREAVNLLAERFSFGGFPDRQEQAANENGPSTTPESVFRIWSPDEIWKPLEPPDYLMDGLLVRGSLALIVAYGSSLKTWVLEDAALSISVGAEWMHRFKTKRARALLIDFESGDYELRRRAHRLARGRELAIPIDGFAFVTMPALSLANEGFFDALRPLASEYGFVGIDSLAAGSGGIDENDARFATSLQRLKAIAAETGCVIVVLHHTRKGNGEDTDQREMVRGSSAIFNACDVVLQMTRYKDAAFAMRQSKARGGKAVEPFIVRVDDIGADASVVLARELPDEGEDQLEDANKALEKAKRAILLLLGGERSLKSKDAVYRRIHGTKSVRVGALKELVDDGLVAVHDGYYRLASEVRQ